MLSNAQQIKTCFSTEISMKKAQNDPTYAAELQQMHDAMVQYAMQTHATPRSIRTVSVVVHVVYNTSAQNISTAYINNMINTMNKDYTFTNSDTGSVRTAFKSVRGNAQIEFCLDSIIRVHTSSTCFDPNSNPDDMKFNNTGGSNAYDPTHYLNIWICKLCGSSVQTGGVAGYTYLPTAGVAGSNYDGVVLDCDLSFINQGSDRVATHETGHYFNLEHTWGNGSIGTCGDDGFTDTPRSAGTYGGCTAHNSCSTPSPGDQIENFMDYADCPHMFTIQQAAEMNRVLTQVRPGLLTSPGCSNASPSAPSADFTSNKTSVCPGSTVSFTDASTGNPTSWSWTFTGGTPSTSTQQNPTITYNTPGTYAVSLTASNANGSNTNTKNGYITVLSASSLPLAEGFQNSTFPPTGWSLLNPDGDITFVRTTSAGGYGASTASAFKDGYNDSTLGSYDLLMSPLYNFTNVTSAKLKFDYAYARYSATYSDTLIVVFTNNCGDSLYLLQQKGGTTLATAPDNTNAFTPTSSQWKTDSIDLSFLAGQSSVQVGFITVNGYGNNIYLDNINLSTPAPAAPVADFSGAPTTVLVGGTVNFTDLSTNSPTSWSWTFPGSVQGSSTAHNPTGIQYNTVGTYNVSLTATNATGSNSKTKTSYINVVNSLPAGCDTLSNILANDTLTIYLADTSANPGYLSGHNKWGDIGKADIFTPSTSGQQLTGTLMYFGVAKFANANSKIKVKAWSANGTGGGPGTVLDSTNLFINTISTTGLTYVAFPHTPTISGNFFVGIEFSYAAGDTVALVTNKISANHPNNTGWEEIPGNTWETYVTGWGPSAKLSNVILPILCTQSTGSAPVAAFTGSPTHVCQGGTVTFTDQSTNTPTSWSWSFPGGTPATSTAQNPTVTYSTAGTYNVSLTATNSVGSNTKTQTNYITVTAPPTGSATATNVSCPGGNNGTVTLTTTGGTSPYTYHWSNNATTQNLTGVAAGNYTVTITDNNGCTSTASKAVTQPLIITLSVIGTNATCGRSNGAATANATGGTPPFTYVWSNTQTGQTISGLAAGTYTVTATDANGCLKVGTTTVTSSAALTLSSSVTNTTCGLNNGSIAITPNGGATPYTYAWSNGQTAATATNLASGGYTVTVNDNGGCSATTSASVGTSTAISATATATQANCGQSNGTATVTPTGGSGYTYHWNNNQTTATATGLAAGNYTVTVTATGGCTTTATASVSNVGGPTVTINNVTNVLCNGGTGGAITINVSGGNGTYTYSWSNSATSQNINNLAAGSYSVSVTSNGCVSTANATVNQPTALTANATAVNVTCHGGNNGSATVQVSGGTTPYNYLWSNGRTTASISNVTSGTYSVTITDNNSCSKTTSVTINQPSQLTVSVSGTNPGCSTNNGLAAVSVFGGTSPYTYLWSNTATTSTISNLATGTYSIVVTDGNGCTANGSTILTSQNGPVVTVSSTPVTCGGSNDGTVSVNISSGTGPYTYNWSTSPAQTTATATGLAAGSYTVTVHDGAGCSTTASVNVTSTGFSIAANQTNITGCNGTSTGSIALTITGGSGNYTYHWSDNRNTSSINGLAAGTYAVTITDNTGGCVKTDSFTITEPSVITDSLVATSTVHNGSTGTASVINLAGGTPPYTFAWSNGGTTQSITGLAFGSYTVTVTDANGCHSISSVLVDESNGINNITDGFKFDVYPNPNNGVFQVNLSFKEQTNYSLQVYNTIGMLVYRVEKTNTTADNLSMDLSSYPSATYFVKLESNDYNLVKKITVFK